MQDGKVLTGYLLSAAALLGPVSYILFAFFETGRLSYFGAPTEFLQVTSFGIIPMVLHVYPGLFATVVVAGLASGIPLARGWRVVTLTCCCITYVLMVLWFVSLTPLWKWIFGCLGLCFGIATLLAPQFTPEIGNESLKAVADPAPESVRHFTIVSRCVGIMGGMAVFTMVFIAAGNKDSALQEYYWVIGSNGVLGFYGDRALVGELHGDVIGPAFSFVELKDVKTEMRFQRIGPLKKYSAWQEEKRF